MSKGLLKLRNLRPGDIFRFEKGKKDYTYQSVNFRSRIPIIRYTAVSGSILYETIQGDALVFLIGETTIEPFSIKKELARPYTTSEHAAAVQILNSFRRPNGTIDREALYQFNLKKYGGEG